MSIKIIYSENLSIKDFEKSISEEVKKIVEFLDKELIKLRVNRVHPSLVEDLKVNIYGKVTLLKGLAVITTPESNIIIISPFDPSNISEIEKALSILDLGGTPKNDGKTIKIIIPPMSQSRRLELVKMVHLKKEESLISIRKIRQEVLSDLKKVEKDKKISEDFSKKLQKSLQNFIEEINLSINLICQKKEKSLLD